MTRMGDKKGVARRIFMRFSHNYTSRSITSLTNQSPSLQSCFYLNNGHRYGSQIKVSFRGGVLEFGHLRKLFEIESSEVKGNVRRKWLITMFLRLGVARSRYENVQHMNTHEGNKKFVRNFWRFLGGL